jgi:hypothetical protein
MILVYQGRGGEELSLELSRALQRSLLGGQSGKGEAVCSLLLIFCPSFMHNNSQINILFQELP